MHEALQKLLSGFSEYKSEAHPRIRAHLAALAAEGQFPHIFVISCSDSRYDPVEFTRAKPGLIYAMRIAGALVPPYEIYSKNIGIAATLEHAVTELGVGAIIVCGHLDCGVAKMLTDGAPPRKSEALSSWLEYAADVPGRAKIQMEEKSGPPVAGESDNHSRACEEALVRLSLENLATYPFIARKLASGELEIAGWWYDFAEAKIFELNADGALIEL